MRRTLLTITLLFLQSTGVSAFNLDSLLSKSVGGPAAAAKLRSVSTIYAAGKASLNGFPASYDVAVAIPNRLCMELKLGPIDIVQAYDGARAWQRDQNGQVSLLSGYEERALLSQVYFQTYSFLFDDRLPGAREYLGVEEHEGVTCHKVAFYPMFVDTVYSFFEVATGRQRYDVLSMDNLEIVTEYADHAFREGVLMALTARSSAPAAQTVMEMTIDSLAFNVPIDSTLFLSPQSVIDYRFPAGADSVLVPFELVAGHIYFPARVNGRLLRFLLDSGASANLFHRSALDGLNLPVVGSLPAIGVAGYEQVSMVRTDSLEVAGLVLMAQVGGVLDLDLLAGQSKPDLPFGGLLGYDFLSRFPVLVDYNARTLKFYDPETFEPPPGGHEVPFTLTLQIPTIEADLDGITGRYLVDLGNAFGVIVHRDFSRKYDLMSRLDNVTDLPHEIKGVGGGISGKAGDVASFAFGDMRIADLRVILPDSGSGLAGSVELAGNIGNLLLSRFRVLFDYRGQRLLFYESERSAEE